MSNFNLYQVISHLDEPKRYFTLTLDEVMIAGLTLLLLVISNRKLVVTMLGLLLYSALRMLKKGQGPRFLLVLAYWQLPKPITQLFVPTLPASYQRVWLS